MKSKEKKYDEVVAKRTEHYSSDTSRSRQAGESMATYVAELRRLAQHCNYGDTLHKMLRDRIIWG